MDIKENFYSKLQQIREESEQLDEISDKLRKKYIAKAARDAAEYSGRAEQDRQNNSSNQEAHHRRKARNRLVGIDRAVKGLKEEQLDELRGKGTVDKKEMQSRIRKKHDAAWEKTQEIRKEKKSAGSADTKDMDKYRNRLARMHNKLDEGIMKKIKRSFQGWDKNATDLKGNPSRPKDVVKRAKEMGDEDAKGILQNLEKNAPSKHSPADLQYKALKRRFKKK